MKKIMPVLLAAALIILLLAGCAVQKTAETDLPKEADMQTDQTTVTTSGRKISTFFLSRYGDIYYDSYQISREQDGYQVSVSGMDDQPIDTAAVDALMQIIDEYNVDAWDGFSKSNEYVMDGEGFLLEVELTDGTSITASGDNAFPENYYPVVSSLQEILDNAVTGEDEEGDD